METTLTLLERNRTEALHYYFDRDFLKNNWFYIYQLSRSRAVNKVFIANKPNDLIKLYVDYPKEDSIEINLAIYYGRVLKTKLRNIKCQH